MGHKKSRAVIEKSLRLYTWVTILIFVVLIGRLAWLQLIETEIYRLQADTNIIRKIPDTASRGEMVDRNGNVLVTNRMVFNLSLDYLSLDKLEAEEREQVIDILVQILQEPTITRESIQEAIRAQRNRLYEPITVKRDIPIDLVTTIEERKSELIGVSIEVQPQRSYPYGNLAGHLLGYVHSIKEELELPEYADYGMSDLVGKIGLEKSYEQYLRGENGFRQMEVTATNRPVREVLNIPSVPGHKLVLTLDLRLQQVMEEAFDATLLQVQEKFPKAQAGAAVLLDVKTGKILASTSRPTLNPDDFNGNSLNQDQADYYFRNLPPAMNNRVIQGSYVPGSTFKPITGMAALEAGVDPAKDYVNCTGRYWHAPYIKCIGVHGKVNYYTAMAKSCNVYFQEMARRAGIEMIGKVGNEFGLGKPSGIDIPFESTGILPSLEWQKQEFQKRRDRINDRIDKTISNLEKEYQEKIDAAPDSSTKRRLENELKSRIRSWEQQRKQELAHYTTWHDWDSYNTGIGQGYNEYSIIQMANYTATIANGGKLYRPYIVEKIIAADGSVVKEVLPELRSIADVSPQTIEETQKAMLAVASPGGTAYHLFRNLPADIKVCAKTGTSQPGRTGYGSKDFDGLFIAFAPADDPEIAFAGVIEYGNSGSGSIGLVAKALFEEYFRAESPQP